VPTIHPLSVVSPQSQLADDVRIGPFCVVEDDVQIGAGTHLDAYVIVRSGTRIGRNNRVHDRAILGGLPQHLIAEPPFGELIIGDGNVIRENVTVHRGIGEGKNTIVGDSNMLMVNAHVAHDCTLGNNCIIANNVMLSGHIELGDRAYLSGAVGVHQFCRVGSYAMVGGQAHITQDVPPYVTVDGLSSRVVGLNTVGLKRAGFSREDIANMKEAYHVIYRQGLTWKEVIAELRSHFTTGPASVYADFFATGKRGFVQERRTPRGATLKFRVHPDGEPTPVRKTGTDDH
jgi:UDP-N-acetylglucosamine acyltransferase